MQESSAVISLGSNIDAQRNFERVLQLLAGYFKVDTVSSFIKTKPIGITDQPDFLNGAVLIHTERSRNEVRIILKQIEDQLGRDRSAPKFGPRTIDLDIVVWNKEVVDNDYYERDFLKKSVDELLNGQNL